MTRDTPPLDDPAAHPCGLTAVVAGTGDDLVLVHGALGDYRQWAAVSRRLQAARTVIAISRRHHWPQRPPPAGAPYSYEGQRDDLLCYLAVRGRPVHLVGHSWGAGLVLLAALRHPACLRTLTLIEPAFSSLLPADAPGLAAENASRASMLEAIRSLVRDGHDEAAGREMIDWTQGGAGGFDRLPADARQALVQNAATVGPTFSQAAPVVTIADVGALQLPILLVRGERTRLYYRLIVDTLAGALRGAQTALIPGAGHMSIVESPEAVAEAVDAFLNRNERATSHERPL